MDGNWSTGNPDRQEIIQQPKFNRMKILRVNTIAAVADQDASGFVALDPNVAPLSVNVSGGPHFILSPDTNDSRPTLGYEFGLIAIPGGATFLGAGFTVTAWRLVTTTMQEVIAKNWLSFEPETVAFNELFHSFDSNTFALRFQIANVDVDGPLLIAFAEL